MAVSQRTSPEADVPDNWTKEARDCVCVGQTPEPPSLHQSQRHVFDTDGVTLSRRPPGL